MINATINDQSTQNQANSEPMGAVVNPEVVNQTAVAPVNIANPTPTPINTPPSFNETPKKPKKKKSFDVKMIAGVFVLLLIMVGASAGFFLSQQSQDIRQQASIEDIGSEDPYFGGGSNPDLEGITCPDHASCLSCGDSFCNINTQDCNNESCVSKGVPKGGSCNFTDKKCALTLVCHCDDGDRCTTSSCEDPSETKNICLDSGRSWCNNQYGKSYTCCEPGYSCGTCPPGEICESGNGCYPDGGGGGGGGGETPPPTPPALTCNSTCTSNDQCSDLGLFCDTETSNRCRLQTNPTSEACEPPVTTTDPICKDIAILDTDDNILDPLTTNFSIGMSLKFRCASEDPNSLVTNYEFKIIEPNGTVITGDTINSIAPSPISKIYEISQYLDHEVQCRVCETSGCQDWIDIIN